MINILKNIVFSIEKLNKKYKANIKEKEIKDLFLWISNTYEFIKELELEKKQIDLENLSQIIDYLFESRSIFIDVEICFQRLRKTVKKLIKKISLYESNCEALYVVIKTSSKDLPISNDLMLIILFIKEINSHYSNTLIPSRIMDIQMNKIDNLIQAIQKVDVTLKKINIVIDYKKKREYFSFIDSQLELCEKISDNFIQFINGMIGQFDLEDFD